MNKKNLIWIAQIAVVVIMGQTLFFKFTDHPETVALFDQLGQGALAYKSIGALELIACILLLIPRSITIGAGLAVGLMSGAIMAHITELGFTGPNGALGWMAVAAWILSLVIMYVRRTEIPILKKILASS